MKYTVLLICSLFILQSNAKVDPQTDMKSSSETEAQAGVAGEKMKFEDTLEELGPKIEFGGCVHRTLMRGDLGHVPNDCTGKGVANKDSLGAEGHKRGITEENLRELQLANFEPNPNKQSLEGRVVDGHVQRGIASLAPPNSSSAIEAGGAAESNAGRLDEKKASDYNSSEIGTSAKQPIGGEESSK